MKTLLLVCTFCTLSHAQMTVRGAAGGTGEYDVRPLRTVPTVAWEARPGFRDFGAMVVSGSVIVTGNISGTGGVFGFDTASGKRLWGIPEQMKGEPAADAKSAYVITGGPGVVSRLSSLNLKTGRTQWFAEDVGLGSFLAAPVAGDGKVIGTPTM